MPTSKIEKDRTFSNMTLHLDETSFLNCIFDSCDIYYSGGLFDAVDCEWRNNRFHFRDAAWRTSAFLADMGWLKDNVPFAISYDEVEKSN
jgi:hypothetical protein